MGYNEIYERNPMYGDTYYMPLDLAQFMWFVFAGYEMLIRLPSDLLSDIVELGQTGELDD